MAHRRSDVPGFDSVNFAQQVDYSLWQDVNNIMDYLERIPSTVAEAKTLMNLKDANGAYPLHRAVDKNDMKSVISFLKLGGQLNAVDETGKTPLFYAVARGNKPMLTILLHKGGSLHDRDEDGTTLLHVAAEVGNNLEIIKFLLDAGFHPDVPDKFQWTPLHKACWYGCLDAGRLLLERGAGLNSRTDTKVTPIIMAVSKRHRKLVELLLQRGADPNFKPDSGWTALHRAAAQGDTEMTLLLLYNGADMYMTDNFGRTPMELAIEGNCPEVVHLFTKKGYLLKTNIGTR